MGSIPLLLYSCILLYSAYYASIITTAADCSYSSDMSAPIASILCAVEKKYWFLDPESPAIKNAGCLLGKKTRCESIMKVPTEKQVPESKAPPAAKNKQYQALAMAAEAVVPQTWWRKGFANDLLLLSHNDSELPRKQFDASKTRNKKLKNIVQCVTRQQFIRKSFPFNATTEPVLFAKGDISSKCNAMNEPVVQKFFTLWTKDKDMMGGVWKDFSGLKVWYPNEAETDSMAILASAKEVLDYFYTSHGGVWTGCFKFEKDANCRGALAAASSVVAIHTLIDCAVKHVPFHETTFVGGYMLATLGRGVLHGDTGTTGNLPLTLWGVRCADFVGLQAAYLRLYIDSFGKIYSTQLDTFIPVAFTPTFVPHAKPIWKHLSSQLEPVYTSLRNWMFTESQNLIDFGPYRPLVSFPEVRDTVKNTDTKKRVLIDVGANGFFASPKYLLDSYAPYLPFTHAIMVEPEPHFSASIPQAYSDRYNISFLQIYAEVATGSDTDMIKLLPTLVSKEDFVVLKFDVDPNRYAQGPTMEWGFMFSIMQNPRIAELVDELYIELHFHFPSLYWYHYHSNWEALDAFRYLRQHGCIVHSWP